MLQNPVQTLAAGLCRIALQPRFRDHEGRHRRPAAEDRAAARRGGAGLQRTAGLLRQPDREINEFRRYPETSARPYYHPTFPQHPAGRNSIAGIIVFPDREYNIVFDNSKYNIAPHETSPTDNTTQHCTDTK